MNTQPTPETDAEHARFPMGGFTLDFARKLERERDEARMQRDGLHRLHNDSSKRRAELLELCRTLRQERDEARRQLAAAQADQDNDTQAELAAWEMHGKAIRERDEWKALAVQYSSEREHNAMQALSYKAERDALQDQLVRLTDTKRPSRETSNKLDLTP